MAYRKKDMEKKMLEVIKEKKIAFFEHCFAYTPFGKTTAYAKRLNESNAIKAAIEKNRVTAKNYMLNKWIGGNNQTLQVAAYRLLSTPEEHRKLNQQYTDHTSDGEKLIPIRIQVAKD